MQDADLCVCDSYIRMPKMPKMSPSALQAQLDRALQYRELLARPAASAAETYASGAVGADPSDPFAFLHSNINVTLPRAVCGVVFAGCTLLI